MDYFFSVHTNIWEYPCGLRWLLRKLWVKFIVGWKDTTNKLKVVFPFTCAITDSSHARLKPLKERTWERPSSNRSWCRLSQDSAYLRVLSGCLCCRHVLTHPCSVTAQFCFWKTVLMWQFPWISSPTSSELTWRNVLPQQNCHIWMFFWIMVIK